MENELSKVKFYTCYDAMKPDSLKALMVNVLLKSTDDLNKLIVITIPSGPKTKIVLFDKFKEGCNSSYNTKDISLQLIKPPTS